MGPRTKDGTSAKWETGFDQRWVPAMTQGVFVRCKIAWRRWCAPDVPDFRVSCAAVAKVDKTCADHPACDTHVAMVHILCMLSNLWSVYLAQVLLWYACNLARFLLAWIGWFLVCRRRWRASLLSDQSQIELKGMFGHAGQGVRVSASYYIMQLFYPVSSAVKHSWPWFWAPSLSTRATYPCFEHTHRELFGLLVLG